ncbi:MAG: hypothetical protein PHP16_05790, partial [Eubacteriales bacterium]|nr:hypothetical protein [Eubacteriales bacterium]
YEAIVKGENIPEPGVPEAFKVLVKELQSLCLDVHILSEENEEMDIPDSSDELEDESVTGRTLLNMIGEEAPADAEGEAFDEEGFTDGVLDEEGAIVSESEDEDKEPLDGQDEDQA